MYADTPARTRSVPAAAMLSGRFCVTATAAI
jgi:hypothetical protein